MFDILLESVGGFISTIIFMTLLIGTRHPQVRAQPGSGLVVAGFGLLWFSLMIDITDNFPALNGLVVVGDTEYQAFLEKVVGMLFGLLLLALGFRRWIPAIRELADTRQSLSQLTTELDQRIRGRTEELELTNKQLTREVTERQKAEEKLRHLALHDPLTTLPNRHALSEFLDHEISRTSRHNYFSAVLFLDLDDFKSINDLMGHETGDRVLKIITERLWQCRRQEDFLGRFGGDEFVIVLTELDTDLQRAATRARTSAQEIVNALEQPLVLDGHRFKASGCVGIRLFPDAAGENVGDLLRQADTALYHAKSKGAGVVSFFHEDMQKLVEQRLNLAGELQEALEKEQLVLHYQPQVTAAGSLYGLEALVRWNHPIRGLIGPDQFIAIAEEAGLIDKLGNWVLRRALQDRAGLLGQKADRRDIKIAVNISPSHFLQTNFVRQVEEVLASCKYNNCHLVLEITEDVVIGDIDDISAKMEALRKLGVGISLDDFGTGYSSLAYIKRLPLDTLKIDRSFVGDIDTDSNDAAIVEAILAMTRSLGLSVIAEGVETGDQHRFLNQRGCQLYQGYLFSRPVPPEELRTSELFVDIEESCLSKDSFGSQEQENRTPAAAAPG